MPDTKIAPDNVQELQQKIAYAEEVKRITSLIHSAKDLDQIGRASCRERVFAVV